MGTDQDQAGNRDGSDIRARRERYGMLSEDLFRKDMKDPIVPGSPSFEAMQVWLKSYNEMVRRMTEALQEPSPEPSKAEDLDTLIDSVTEHSGPAHILSGPHVEEVVREVVAPKDIKVGDFVWKTVTRDPTDPMGMTYIYDPGDAAHEPPEDEPSGSWRDRPPLL